MTLYQTVRQRTMSIWGKAVRTMDQIRIRQSLVYANLAVLTQRYGSIGGLGAYELKVFSQNGEDGVLAEIFSRIGAESRFFVEFGVGPGREGNAVLLADVFNWRGLFIESSERDFAELEYKYRGSEAVVPRNARVTAENIEAILREQGVPSNLDLLSIDIDGNDYWVWQAIRAHRARVVVCEFNGELDPTVALTQPYSPEAGWDKTSYFGVSLKALIDLGKHLGYTLVHTDLTGTNAFFVMDEHADAFSDCFPVIGRRSNPGLTSFRHRPDEKGRAYVTPDPAVGPPGSGAGAEA